MKPRKVYLRNNILHVCFKGPHYAPMPCAITRITKKDRVTVDGFKGDDSVTVCNGDTHETWIKTDVDAAADPRGRAMVPVELLKPRNPPPPRTAEEVAEDDEADLREEEARVKAKAHKAQAQGRVAKMSNILEL